MKRGSKRNRQLDVYIGMPLLNFLATFHFRRKLPAGIRRIGLMCSPALGDTLLFSAVLQDVRQAHPGVQIIHFCMKQNFAAAEIIPGADERVVLDLTAPLSTIRAMRAQRCDVLIDFTSWQRLTAIYSLASHARFTVGFCTPGQRRSRGYDLTVIHSDERHEVENFRALLRGSDLLPSDYVQHAPRITILPLDTRLPEARDIVVFHLWASGQRSWLREWPEDRWIALAQRLTTPATLFLITGAHADLPRTEPFVAKMVAAGLRCEAYVSPDGFRSLTHLLRRARIVISVNTGVMHLAAIAAARVVAINGPNRNGRWGPIGPNAVGIEAPGKGCGYLHLGFNFEGESTDCMERTTVNDVHQAVSALLAARQETR